jgi:hypothetical protein
MDPTIIAAVTGILGVILGAVIGGVFALKATKRQVEVMLLRSRGDVNERLYNQSLETRQIPSTSGGTNDPTG